MMKFAVVLLSMLLCCGCSAPTFTGDKLVALVAKPCEVDNRKIAQQTDKLVKQLNKQLDLSGDRIVAPADIPSYPVYFSTDNYRKTSLKKAIVVAQKDAKITYCEDSIVIAGGDIDITFSFNNIIVSQQDIKLVSDRGQSLIIAKGKIAISSAENTIFYAPGGLKISRPENVIAFNTDNIKVSFAHVNNIQTAALFSSEAR